MWRDTTSASGKRDETNSWTAGLQSSQQRYPSDIPHATAVDAAGAGGEWSRERPDPFALIQQYLPLTVLESAPREQKLGLTDLGIPVLSIPLHPFTTCQQYLNPSLPTFSDTERRQEHVFTVRINFYTVILLRKDPCECQIP